MSVPTAPRALAVAGVVADRVRRALEPGYRVDARDSAADVLAAVAAADRPAVVVADTGLLGAGAAGVVSAAARAGVPVLLVVSAGWSWADALATGPACVVAPGASADELRARVARVIRDRATLRETEGRFQLLLANVRDHAIFFLDPAGRVSGWNESAERSLGYPADEVLGQPFTLFLPPEKRSDGDSDRRISEAAASGRSTIEHWLVRKDGTRLWGSCSLTALRDPAGGLRGFAKIVQDLTETRAVREQARTSRERLDLALTAARMGVWQWDVAGDRHVRDANLNRMLGLPATETVQPFADLRDRVHPDDRDRVVEAFEATVRRGQPLNVEFRVVWPDGTVRWIHNQGDATPPAPGRPETMTGACVDVTDRKEIEEEVRRARDELELRVGERTAELASVVAELQQEAAERRVAEAARETLLNRVVTAQEEERLRIARELHDSLGQYLAAMAIGLRTLSDRAALDEAVRADLARLDRLTADVNREVHRLAVELRPTALDDVGLCAAVQNAVEAWAERTGIAADFSGGGMDHEAFPWPTATTVYRVVQEALTNVAKHAGATRVSVLLDRRPDHILTIVEDDGRGFDPDRPDARTPGGGLGLRGMAERAALVGGSLQIESAPGAGTTVFARIPAPPASTPAPPQEGAR